MADVIKFPLPGSPEWMEWTEARRQAALEASLAEAHARILERAKKLSW